MGRKIFFVLILMLVCTERSTASRRNVGNLKNISVDFGEEDTEGEILREVEVISPRRIDGKVRGMELREVEGDVLRPDEYMWPIEWRGVTSQWGYRRDPITGKLKVKHSGIDLRAKIGTPVYAPAPGVVRVAGWLRGYGKIVILDHQGGYSTRFAHLDSFRVKSGDLVRMGERIAATGNTGRSTGPHLHYEIRKDEVALNPMEFKKGQETDYAREKISAENLEVTLREKEEKSIDI